MASTICTHAQRVNIVLQVLLRITIMIVSFSNLLSALKYFCFHLRAPLRLREAKLTGREIVIGDDKTSLLLVLIFAELFLNLVIFSLVLLIVSSYILAILLVPLLLTIHIIVDEGFILLQGVSWIDKMTLLLEEPEVLHHRVF